MSKKKIKRPRGRPRKIITTGAKKEISQAIAARAVVAKIIENPGIKIADAIRSAGLSENIATHPGMLTKSAPFIDLLNEYLPDGELLETHRGLLKAARIDHMVFADGPKDALAAAEWLANKNAKAENTRVWTYDDILTDDDIVSMLAEKNCDVRRISRTENSRHVYFWSPDSKARKDALDLAYKLKGSYAADKAAVAFSLAALAKLREAPPGDTAAIPAPPVVPVIGMADDD